MGAVLVGLVVATYFAMAAEQARRQDQQKQQAEQLRRETHLKLLALQRQQAALQDQERRQQELAAQDAHAFQRDALQTDLPGLRRDVAILRRSARDRQVERLQQERERRDAAIEEIVKQGTKARLVKERSAACNAALPRYLSCKADPSCPAARLQQEYEAVTRLCG